MGYVTKPHAGRLRVALAFPNTYWVGMSNLGFQTVYQLFNELDDVVCERFFLPPKQTLAELEARGTRLVSLESQTPIADFDVVAFSVSFEWDYPNVVTLLRRAGLPTYAEERSEKHPLVVIGGAVTFVNPEPLAPFADLITAGEGESLAVGRPLVVTPIRDDQPAIADQVNRAGCGVRLHFGRLTARGLRDALGRVLDEPSFADAAARVQASFAAAGGADRAATLLEDQAP